ncbi:hypothetical protein IWQ60_010667, partial [Tieghemiomyces parasiticus]
REAFFAHLTLAHLASAGMKLPLATVATLVAVLIAHEGALVAAGPTGADTTVPNDASAPAFVEQERGVASDAFPAYCPRIITSSFLKKGRAALDYTGLWKKKLDPKDETVEKVADWLSVRLAYARMGHNYTDPTIVSGPPSFTIWVPPVGGLAPIANPVSNYQATGINQLAFIDGVAKHYKKKPVYINIDHRVLGQPAGRALVSVLDTCFGGAITGIPRSTYGAPGVSDYPMTNQFNPPPQDGYGYNNAAPYNAPPQDGYGYNNAAPYNAPPQDGYGYNNAAPYNAPPQDGYGYNNAAPYNAPPQNSGYPTTNQYGPQRHSELPKIKSEQQQYDKERKQYWEQQRRNQQLQQQAQNQRNEQQPQQQQAAASIDDLISFSTPLQANQQPTAPDHNAYQK